MIPQESSWCVLISESRSCTRVGRIYFEGFGLEIAKCNSLVKVGMVYALERADGLRGGDVIAEIVWNGTEILTMDQ